MQIVANNITNSNRQEKFMFEILLVNFAFNSKVNLFYILIQISWLTKAHFSWTSLLSKLGGWMLEFNMIIVKIIKVDIILITTYLLRY